MEDRARNSVVSVGAKDSRIEFSGVTSNPCNDFFSFRVALQNEALIEKEWGETDGRGRERGEGGGR